MNKLQDWARNHPYKAITFLAIAVTIGIVAANGDLSLLVAGVLMSALFGLWVVVVRIESTGGTP